MGLTPSRRAGADPGESQGLGSAMGEPGLGSPMGELSPPLLGAGEAGSGANSRWGWSKRENTWYSISMILLLYV